ncbi:hypothetical protein GDO81_017237 [Engystomops pustulosus]|uniref:Leptin receptor n=1 Tax=Engystomops pustulosus TaxID=76066 RepID=A0AAV7ACM1_ENGPU|nr:hypothetical protein GDO81_017237 [Engystomops pustulosus]
MMIWERINHAYSSDSTPLSHGLQKGDYGFQNWILSSSDEGYSVAWDTYHSYWKVKVPFGPLLCFLGPLFIDKSENGLWAPPLQSVTISDTDVLIPASPSKVNQKILKITNFVLA